MAKPEHGSAPLAELGLKSRPYMHRKPVYLTATVCLTLFPLLYGFYHSLLGPFHRKFASSTYSVSQTCHQVPALRPQNESQGLHEMDEYLVSETFRNASIQRLSDAVKIPTESFDDLGAVGNDSRWDIFYDFASFLKSAFPRTHATLTLEKINTHGLLYTWHGEDPTLKPTVLMAHQDVVPVPKDTVGAWTHPPFSGFYDGKLIWGRGASDCKNQLIGILESIEQLIEADFKPRRSIILSFGFDEEISGHHGAAYLADYLSARHGNDGIAAIVDEGSNFDKTWGMTAALLGVGEKGYIDVDIVIRMPGGHSSVPPDHTSIGVMSELITLIEANPYSTRLAAGNPYLSMLRCGAEHGPDFPAKLKKLLRKRSKHNCVSMREDHLALEAAKQGPAVKYLMQTSIAVDIISGGVKNNALPERTEAVINHRVNIGEHTSIVRDKITHLARKVAQKHNLTLHAFDGTEESPRSISLTSLQTLEPAPVTPTDASHLSPWTVLAGTTRALYGEDIIVTPAIMTGNTDTKWYWNLTKHIFRYGPGWDGESTGLGNIHTVDESVSVRSHVNVIRWMSLFIRNMDYSELD